MSDLKSLKQIIHIQVGGNPSADKLLAVAKQITTAVEEAKAQGQDQITLNTDASITVNRVSVPEGSDFSALTISSAINVEFIARVAHTLNRDYASLLGESVLPWEQLSQQSREGFALGVLGYLRHRYTPEQQHQAWSDSKLAAGWTYGEVRDDEKKLHPNLVPYSQLSQGQHLKDFLFQSVVRALEQYLPLPLADTKVFLHLDVAEAAAQDIPRAQWLDHPELWTPRAVRDLDVGQIVCTEASVEDVVGHSVFKTVSKPYVKYGMFDASYSIDVQHLFHRPIEDQIEIPDADSQGVPDLSHQEHEEPAPKRVEILALARDLTQEETDHIVNALRKEEVTGTSSGPGSYIQVQHSKTRNPSYIPLRMWMAAAKIDPLRFEQDLKDDPVLAARVAAYEQATQTMPTHLTVDREVPSSFLGKLVEDFQNSDVESQGQRMTTHFTMDRELTPEETAKFVEDFQKADVDPLGKFEPLRHVAADPTAGELLASAGVAFEVGSHPKEEQDDRRPSDVE